MKKKTRRKCSRAYLLEESARLDVVRQLLSLGCFEATIRSECFYRWSLSVSKANKLIRKAQAQVLSGSSKSKKEHKRDAIAFLDEIIRSPESDDRHRIKAQEQKSRILGLEAPVNIRTDIEIRAEENRKLAISIEKDNPKLVKEILRLTRQVKSE